MNTKTIKFDLNKYKLYEKIKAKQGDTKSRFLLFQLLDGSIPFNLKNRSVRAYMIKPDGREIFNDLIVNNYNLGYCTLELTNQVLAAQGIVKIELMVTEGDKKLTSSVFELEVVKSINSEKSIVSTNEFTALLNGLAALSEYDNYKNSVKEMEINKANKAEVEEKFISVEEKIKNNSEQLDNIEIKKTDKIYVDTQDDYLLKQIGQGVTDEQLKNAVQSKIDDGSIASISVGVDGVRPLNLNNGAKSVEPLIWRISEDSIVKSDNSITISSNVGVVYRDKFIYVTPNTYLFDSTDRYLILRDVTLQINPTETHTPIIVRRVDINENDIILAYYSAQIVTVWDSIIGEYISNKNKTTLSTPFTTAQRTPLGGFATITSRSPFNIDTINKTITFDVDTFINYNGKFIKLSSNVVDITNALKGGWLWYDAINNKVIDTKPTSGENYIYLGTLWVNPIVVNINNECGFTLNGMPYNYQNGRWNGEVLNAIGDSITYGVGCTVQYHQWLKQLCGFKTVNNYGVSGSTIARRPDNSISWDTATALVDRINLVDKTAKVTTVFMGVNDFITGRLLGTFDSTDVTTFYGALHYVCKYFRENMPDKIVTFITPMQFNWKLRPPVGNNTDGTNKNGNTLLDFVNVIKEVCGFYGYTVLDMYHNCFYGLSDKTVEIFMPDKLHINDLGHKEIMAPRIASHINSH